MFSNSGVNKVLLLGQITNDPFKNQPSKGTDYLCIRLLTTENIKKGTDITEHNEYHNLKIPAKLLQQESLELQAGHLIYVEGKLQTTQFTDHLNIRRYDLDIIVYKVEVLDVVPVTG